MQLLPAALPGLPPRFCMPPPVFVDTLHAILGILVLYLAGRRYDEGRAVQIYASGVRLEFLPHHGEDVGFCAICNVRSGANVIEDFDVFRHLVAGKRTGSYPAKLGHSDRQRAE